MIVIMNQKLKNLLPTVRDLIYIVYEIRTQKYNIFYVLDSRTFFSSAIYIIYTDLLLL